MPKTAMLTVRVEPQLKSDAEAILGELGIPAGSAITMFYKQIVIHRGLPFAITLDPQPVPSLDRMTREEFDRELSSGEQARIEGRATPLKDALNQVRERAPARLSR